MAGLAFGLPAQGKPQRADLSAEVQLGERAGTRVPIHRQDAVDLCRRQTVDEPIGKVERIGGLRRQLGDDADQTGERIGVDIER